MSVKIERDTTGVAAGWNPRRLPRAEGKVFVITGGHAGIGYFISEQLAHAGATVVMASRSQAKAQNAIASIRARVPGARVSYLHLDLSSLSSVAETATALRDLPRVDALVLNAAAILTKARTETADGNETVFGVNVVGNFALAAQAMAVLERTAGSRLITLASIAPWLARLRTLDMANLNSTTGAYQSFPTYARSKAAQMLIALELDRRLRGSASQVTSVLAHPGGAHDGLSPRRAGVMEPTVLRRIATAPLFAVAQGKDRGAWPIVRAALDPVADGGQIWGPRLWSSIGQPRVEGPTTVIRRIGLLDDDTLARATWDATADLAGVEWGERPPGTKANT
ncbi:NAD(P)-dependent dehydrogenase (short-subunit alcohol dehydrogenase family) [Conyzicola lurida]|uniref:NAD(P)-dependent dehydrogenase (Short-subunit alcohol dehydrogenase family) n=1 Tax=Conyzicola lurida TaxID=1172621 RepID=A0A841APM2_9MICO|nr:SDR family NAD(P)-dependent oxidoreductase [Conyzicola lurida]MBB5843505.1 NAD(P)-dependent dehydrogenase (short-subunit alcohol dehydrogenase family) [Conyzicola lurida]